MQVPRQAPLPLQNVPPHSPAGSVPDAAKVHVPRFVVVLQDWQGPAQSELQQTPSTQLPDWQSPPLTQPVPLAWLPAGRVHLPPTHRLVATQSDAEAQEVVHAPLPLHTKPAHSLPGSDPEGTLMQLPTLPTRLHAWHVPLHEALQHTPSTHADDAHSVCAVHE